MKNIELEELKEEFTERHNTMEPRYLSPYGENVFFEFLDRAFSLGQSSKPKDTRTAEQVYKDVEKAVRAGEFEGIGQSSLQEPQNTSESQPSHWIGHCPACCPQCGFQGAHCCPLAQEPQKIESFTIKRFGTMEEVRGHIQECEGRHSQQVAYSTFHDGLTQICFGCKKIRTTLNA